MSTDAFFALPQYLQRRIDKAFNGSATSYPTESSSAGGFIPSSGASGGGFLVEDSGGGFLAENDSVPMDNDSLPSQILLSLIPSALQRLDLPPDDAQVLLVFKNAASGWKSSTNRPEEIGAEADAEEAYVSREDWRAVCAVLLEHHAEEYDESDGAGAAAVADQLVEGDSDADEDEDEYHQDAEPSADSDSDSDEYMEGPSTRRRTRTTAKRRARSSSSSSASSVAPPDSKKRRKLTARQAEACLATYALFFPSASKEELPNQRIGIKDVQRLSKLIGDKLKGDEIIEMLSEFSTSPDKSMSFADFGDMMRAVKLV
ncbi:hypothetical protein B0H13DRAFT_1731675 [Mycena leptocephala]|nr:hypothetical protein B0H13DRAFT_1731675 [Mycena leptocephala]